MASHYKGEHEDDDEEEEQDDFVELVSAWLTVINVKMRTTMRRRSRMMRLKMSLSSSS